LLSVPNEQWHPEAPDLCRLRAYAWPNSFKSDPCERLVNIDNLLSGLLGAVLGVAGAVLIQWVGTRRAHAAAARAVFMEVNANLAALNLARQSGVYAPLTASTWLAEQIRLAHGLSIAGFVIVASFYNRVEIIRGRGFRVAGPPDRSLQAVAMDAFARGEKASRVLELRGWRWPWERTALAKAASQLDPFSGPTGPS
jgi:hypothetical protein